MAEALTCLTASACPCPIDTGTDPLYAATVDSTGGWFDGGIDEIAIYDDALAPAQVQTHCNAR
ncbi:MAG TPA: hypothetical protein VHF25_03760 [Nitriliruptorales bacterium]|nr:hypothetical protein [Nitriliruptorales bacterium]